MQKILKRDQNGSIIMQQKNLKIICEREGLYSNPENNETIYFHFKGFEKIENLESYTNLVALWLNNNALQTIEGLDKLKNLVSLFLNHNLIDKISNLEMLVNLNTLNLQHNSIKKIENLNTLIHLQNLNLSYNQLTDYDSLKGILECPSIQNLDLSNNHISYEENILQIFQKTNVACLYLKANNIVRECPNYRRRLVSSITTLQYLDNKPVALQERKMCEAWLMGGKEAEEYERISQIYQKKEQDHTNYLQTLKKQENGEIRNILLKKQQNICREITVLQVLLDEGENQKAQLELKEEELKNVEDELQNYQLLELPPFRCYMTTQDNFDKQKSRNNRIILNKTEEEERIIKERCFINENDSFGKVNNIQERDQNENQFNLNLRSPEKVIQASPEKQAKDFENKREGWTKDHDYLLENLLMHYQFDFEVVSRQFKKIMQIDNQNFQDLEQQDLKQIWSCIEQTKYRNRSQKNFEDID